MKKHILAIAILVIAVAGVLFLSQWQGQKCEEANVQYLAAVDRMDALKAKLDSLSFAEGDKYLEEAQTTAADTEAVQAEIQKIREEMDALQEQLTETLTSLSEAEENNAFYLEVYHALKDGYEKVLSLLSDH